MRDMVIVFLVLLAILILISAFGGCIRFKESYENEVPIRENDYSLLAETLKPWETNPVFAPGSAEEHGVKEEEENPRVLFDQEDSINEETQEISGIASTPMSIGGGLEFAELE